jgi:hypothetical protein
VRRCVIAIPIVRRLLKEEKARAPIFIFCLV